MTTPAASAAKKPASAPRKPTVPMTRRLNDAEARISIDQWDADAWNTILHQAALLPFPTADILYTRLVNQFPTHARFWNARAHHCARDAAVPSTTAAKRPTPSVPDVVPLGAVLGEPSAKPSTEPEPAAEAPAAATPSPPAPPVDPVVEIYEAAVKDAPTSVDIWRAYAAYALGRATPGAENPVTIIFERAVNACGLDLNASPLWQDYIDYLKTRASLSDSQRRDALRRVYNRSVCAPVQGLDVFWRDYTAFEQKANTNKEIGRALLAEYQPKNVDARTEYRARKGRREGLALAGLPIPPRGRAKEASQAAHWRRFIAQERANPSGLGADALHARVVHAFESALVPLYRYPDMWVDYLAYLHGALLPPVEVPLAAAGTPPAPKPPAHDPAKVRAAAAAVEPVAARAARALPACVALHVHLAALWARLARPQAAVAALDRLCRAHPSPLAYVHLMRVARRVDGRDAARKVFGRARKDPRGADPAVYVAAAQMEFRVNRDSKVAKNVFEFGLKKFATSAVMAGAFVEWLWGLGDFEFMRVVFEKVMPGVRGDADSVARLWRRWIDVEGVLGDHASVDRVENMWIESGAVGRPAGVVPNVLRRCRFLALEGMTEEQIAVVGGSQGKTSAAGGGNAGGGKRDPRTGRRVQSSGGSSGNGGSGHGGRNGGGGGGGAGGMKLTAMQAANEALMRLSAALGHVAGPPPAVDFIINLIMKTPMNFAHTPAGGAMLPGMGNGVGGMGDGQSGGKKRKADDGSQATGMAPGPTAAPPIDVFRSRQAAKQSRLR